MKPYLHLSNDVSVSALAKLHEKLTGKQPTPAEMAAAQSKLAQQAALPAKTL